MSIKTDPEIYSERRYKVVVAEAMMVLFNALSRTEYRVLSHLIKKTDNGAKIAREIQVSPSTVSRAIRRLRELEILITKKDNTKEATEIISPVLACMNDKNEQDNLVKSMGINPHAVMDKWITAAIEFSKK